MNRPDVLHGLHVLVVDDEPDSRDLLATMLEFYGARVSTANDAYEGLSAIEEGRPDVLLSDICMPGRDGYDFLRAVRALPDARGGRTPAAAVTALASNEDRARAVEVGFNRYLHKPVVFAQVVGAVAELARGGAAAPAGA